MLHGVRQRCIVQRDRMVPAAAVVRPVSRSAHATASRALYCKAAVGSSSNESACTSNFTVRGAQSGDTPILAVIEQLCSDFSAGWDEEQIQDELNRDFSQMLVAADSGTDQPLGYIVGWVIAGELQILELAVHPAHQSKGIGSTLLGALLQQCRCPEGVAAVLEVKACNKRAIKLYEKHGFHPVGLRRKYYADGSDAVLMTRAG